MKNNTKKIVWCFAFIIIVAVIGSVFVNLGGDWFNSLITPTEWVSNFIIPIMWTIIYGLFALICFLWYKNGEIPKNVLALMVVNGILNVLWCLVFFTLNQLLLGNIVIILNLIAGYFLFSQIYKNKKCYAYTILIYPVWLSIATTLNLALWILN